jgi:hypothetical protein
MNSCMQRKGFSYTQSGLFSRLHPNLNLNGSRRRHPRVPARRRRAGSRVPA